MGVGSALVVYVLQHFGCLGHQRTHIGTDLEQNEELRHGEARSGDLFPSRNQSMWFCSRHGLDYSPEKRRLGLGDCLEDAVSVGLGLPMRARVLEQVLLSS